MATTPVHEMTERARDVFRMVVENYLGSGAPVGSRTISRLPGINLSPASIRAVMQDLEELGLLGHPHTSAGRVPTESGLRLFVDGMMQAAEPSAEERAAIEGRIERGGPVEEALTAATAALSGLSACAGIVLVPKREPVLRQLGFVPLSPTQALAGGEAFGLRPALADPGAGGDGGGGGVGRDRSRRPAARLPRLRAGGSRQLCERPPLRPHFARGAAPARRGDTKRARRDRRG